MAVRFRTPGPAVSKSTAGLESVVARMIVLRILSGGSSSATAWLAAVSDLLIFWVGSSRPMTRAPTAGRLVPGTTKVSLNISAKVETFTVEEAEAVVSESLVHISGDD